MRNLFFKKSKLALFLIVTLMLSNIFVFAAASDEITFSGHSSVGMGGNSAGTQLKLVLSADGKFRLETTKPRGNGTYKITSEDKIYKICFTYDELVDNAPLEMIGTVSSANITDSNVIIKIENVLYNIPGMNVMKMGEVEFKSADTSEKTGEEEVENEVTPITEEISYTGKAAFGMQPGTFTHMTLSIMPENRFKVETTKPRGEGSYKITSESEINKITFTYDDKTSEGAVLKMEGTVTDTDLSRPDTAIEITNATYPLNGMKPLNMGYLKLMVPSGTPSETLKPMVNAAISMGLIPNELQSAYNTSLTRQETCELIVTLIEKRLDKNIDAILAENNLSIKEGKFADCTSNAVFALEALGIINGTSGTEFKPHVLITREELCVILTNTLKNVFEYPIATSEVKAMDASKISSWAKQSVAFMLELKVNDNAVIALEKGMFNPTGHISREQVYLIILSLAK